MDSDADLRALPVDAVRANASVGLGGLSDNDEDLPAERSKKSLAICVGATTRPASMRGQV